MLRIDRLSLEDFALIYKFCVILILENFIKLIILNIKNEIRIIIHLNSLIWLELYDLIINNKE